MINATFISIHIKSSELNSMEGFRKSYHEVENLLYNKGKQNYIYIE